MRITRHDTSSLTLAGMPEGLVFPVALVLFGLALPGILSFTILPKLLKNPASTLWIPALIAAALAVIFLSAGVHLVCRRERLTLDRATRRARFEQWNAITSATKAREFTLQECQTIRIVTRTERNPGRRGRSGSVRVCVASLVLSRGKPIILDKSSNAHDARVRDLARAVALFLELPLHDLDQSGTPDEDTQLVEQPDSALSNARTTADRVHPRPTIPQGSRVSLHEHPDHILIRWRLLRSGCVVLPLTLIALGFIATAALFLLAQAGIIRSNIPASGPAGIILALVAIVLLVLGLLATLWTLAMIRAESVIRVSASHITREVDCPYAAIARLRIPGNPLAKRDQAPRHAVTAVRVIASSDEIEVRTPDAVFRWPLYQSDRDTLALAAATVRWAMATH